MSERGYSRSEFLLFPLDDSWDLAPTTKRRDELLARSLGIAALVVWKNTNRYGILEKLFWDAWIEL